MNLKRICLIFYMLSILFIGSIEGEESSSLPEIQFTWPADGRTWVVGYEGNEENRSIVEYIPSDQKIESWVDIVTFHTVKGIEASLEDFFKLFVKELQTGSIDNRINSRLIGKSGNSILGEWWIHDKSPKAQHEWIRLFKWDDYLIGLRYTTRNVGMVEEIRKTCESFLKNAKLVDSPRIEEDF